MAVVSALHKNTKVVCGAQFATAPFAESSEGHVAIHESRLHLPRGVLPMPPSGSKFSYSPASMRKGPSIKGL